MSLPMTIVVRPADAIRAVLICVKTCAAARPSLSAVSAVTGSMFAVPRTPSVPKILRCGLGGFGRLAVRIHRVCIVAGIDLKLSARIALRLELNPRRRGGRLDALFDYRPQHDGEHQRHDFRRASCSGSVFSFFLEASRFAEARLGNSRDRSFFRSCPDDKWKRCPSPR